MRRDKINYVLIFFNKINRKQIIFNFEKNILELSIGGHGGRVAVWQSGAVRGRRGPSGAVEGHRGPLKAIVGAILPAELLSDQAYVSKMGQIIILPKTPIYPDNINSY